MPPLSNKTVKPGTPIPGTKCVACNGSGKNSRNKECYPCRGTGKQIKPSAL